MKELKVQDVAGEFLSFITWLHSLSEEEKQEIENEFFRSEVDVT